MCCWASTSQASSLGTVLCASSTISSWRMTSPLQCCARAFRCALLHCCAVGLSLMHMQTATAVVAVKQAKSIFCSVAPLHDHNSLTGWHLLSPDRLCHINRCINQETVCHVCCRHKLPYTMHTALTSGLGLGCMCTDSTSTLIHTMGWRPCHDVKSAGRLKQ